MREDINNIVFEYMLKITKDDSVIQYSRPSTKDSLDKEEIKQYMDEFRPFKSE